MHDIYNSPHFPPPMPEKNDWRTLLRWMISVMNDDDKSMGFIAGCLSYCCKNDGYITERQAVGCKKALNRLVEDFQNWQLDSCQGFDQEALKGSQDG